jgi:hypothetical protein
MARKIKLAAILAKFSLTSWSPIAFKSLLGKSLTGEKQSFSNSSTSQKEMEKKKKKKTERCSLNYSLWHTWTSPSNLQMFDSCLNVLIPSATAIKHNLSSILKSRAQLLQISQCMRCLQGRDYAL